MKNRPWNDVGAEARQKGGRADAAGSTVDIWGVHFGSQNLEKLRKMPSENHEKMVTPKHEN